jgi:oxygen-dependent protoporphyrinogen oxidase
VPAPDHEVVVIGGGICGLAAGWTLRDRDVVVCEASGRAGGRILSHRRDPYWLNLGAHLLPAPGSTVDRLVQETDLRTIEVTGTLRGLALGGKVADSDRPALYPLTLPLGARDRISLARAGLRLQRGVRRYFREGPYLESTEGDEPRVPRVAFLDDRTFASFLEPLSPTIERVFRCAVNRGPSTPEAISAGSGVGIFAHVWGGRRSITARNLLGGTALLTSAIASSLGERVLLRSPVRKVAIEADHVIVETDDGRRLSARQAVVAVPAPQAVRIVHPLPPDLRNALEQLRYRAFLSMAMLTDEADAMPWDRVYSLATPGRSFDMLFNHAQPLRDGARMAGGSLMAYAGADNADRLIDQADEHIRAAFLDDLDTVYVGASAHVTETIVQRWPLGNTIAAPGRAIVQRGLERHPTVARRIQMAGDYYTPIGTMETAATTGVLAARRALRALDAA